MTESAKTAAVSVPSLDIFSEIIAYVEEHEQKLIISFLSLISVANFLYFYYNGLGIAYNDARSHLDIARRVVENLKPGLAQIGSVWLPLPHFLMMLTVWNDFMWHSGASGAIISMLSYVGTGFFIAKTLKKLDVGVFGRLTGVLVFALNANVLYLQSTAMTELLFLVTFMGAAYEFISYYKDNNVWSLSKAAFWIMLSTLTRYDAWFIFVVMAGVVALTTFIKKGFKATEGTVLLFITLGSVGMILWLVWNYLIFGDPMFSFYGPYSAYAQQKQIEEAGELITKFSVFNSVKMYMLTIYHINGLFSLLAAYAGMGFMFLDRQMSKILKFATISILLSPLAFNILALYLGHSIISVPNVFGDNWFNIRYGIVILPSVAILIGYLTKKINDNFKFLLILGLIFAYTLSYIQIPVTIQDALWGASSKNVSQVSRWLRDNASGNQDKIMISAGSHDAIIFSSGFEMQRFIHEGTGNYWKDASQDPAHWVRYIVMRTYDTKDATFAAVMDGNKLSKYNLVLKGAFADIYEIKPQYQNELIDAKAFPKDLNKTTAQGTFITSQTSSTGTSTSNLELASMFTVASTALLMTRIVKKPKPKKVKVKIQKGAIDSQFGSNLVAIKQVQNHA